MDNYFILTGAFGSGKTTLLEQLRTLGYRTVDEPARRVLAQQRRAGSSGVPERDARRFVDLMLSMAEDDYRRAGPATAPVFFDRGIPDNLAYAALSGFDYPAGEDAAQKHRYARRVFFAPAWEQIYTHDEERKASFQDASRFGDIVRSVYERLGYALIDIPLLPVTERVNFVLAHL